MGKIYTKTGDTGTTSLAGGTRVSKDHPRIRAYGKIDELISVLALLRCQDAVSPEIAGEIRDIQINLMNVSARVACETPSVLSAKLKPIDTKEIDFLERRIDAMQDSLPDLHYFVLPAGPRAAAICHIARTQCREAERLCVAVGVDALPSAVFRYLNRLSDYLFILSRFLCHAQNQAEDIWIP